MRPSRRPASPARAAERLHHDGGGPAAPLAPPGDHVLNPGFVMGDATYRDAAVLMPVVARAPAATVLLTMRTPHLTTHAGQIAFPGGKIDPTDASPTAAALREAEEEIGLDPALVTPVGYARSLPHRHRLPHRPGRGDGRPGPPPDASTRTRW